MSKEKNQIDDEFLVCVFCEKLPQDPRLLSCLHSVCVTCARSNLHGSKTWISCPKCKERLTVSDPEKLPTNYWVKNLIDKINIKESLEKKFCSFCQMKGKKHEAAAKCLTCYDLLCQECWKNRHTFTTLTKDHRVVSIEDLKCGLVESEIKSQHQIFCSDHVKEYLRYQCRTCDVPVCRDCVIFKHKLHDFISPKEALELFEKYLHLQVEQFEKDLSHSKTQYLKIGNQTKDNAHREENLKLQIETTCNAMINKINARRRSLERDLAQSLKEPKENLEKEIEMEAKKVRLLDMTVSFCKSMLKYGNDFEILILQKTVMQKMKQISLGKEVSFSLDCRNIIPKFNASWKEPLLELCYETGLHGEEKRSPRDEDMRINKDNDVQEATAGIEGVSVTDKNERGAQCIIKVDNKSHEDDLPKARDKIDRDVTCSFITSSLLVNMHQRPKISSISWINEDSFVAIDQCNGNFHSCSLKAAGKVTMLPNCVDSVVANWCFAVRTGSLELFVFDRNSSFLFKLSNVSVVVAVSPLLPMLACISRSSISIKPDRDSTLFFTQFTDSQGNPLILRNPRFGCMLTTGKFAVSDWEKDFVYFFDEHAKVFRKEFCSPGPISTDQEEHIYIADFFEHRIIVTNFEGSFRKTIDLLPHVLHPRSISISPDYKLAIAFENNITLFQLYKT